MRRFIAFSGLLATLTLAAGVAAWAAPASSPPTLAFHLPTMAQGANEGVIRFSPTMRHLGVVTSNIDFGRLDPATGQIVDGDYLLYIRVELGDAPLSSLEVVGRNPDDLNQPVRFSVTADNPIAEGFASVSDGTGVTPFNIVALNQDTMQILADAPVGTFGTARISIALVDDPKASLRKLPAVTQDITVLVVAPEVGLPTSFRGWQVAHTRNFDRSN